MLDCNWEIQLNSKRETCNFSFLLSFFLWKSHWQIWCMMFSPHTEIEVPLLWIPPSNSYSLPTRYIDSRKYTKWCPAIWWRLITSVLTLSYAKYLSTTRLYCRNDPLSSDISKCCPTVIYISMKTPPRWITSMHSTVNSPSKRNIGPQSNVSSQKRRSRPQ